MPEDGTLKIVVVGDGFVGKTCLCISFHLDHFPWDYIPSVFDHYSWRAEVAGRSYTHSLIDTSQGGEDYDRLRPLNYPETSVFMMLFSVEKRSSLESIEGRWLPEIRSYMPDTPILLVATKIDLRGSSQHDCITFEEGFNLAQKHNLAYTETSALLNTNGKDHVERPPLEMGCSSLPPCPNHEEVDVFHLYFSAKSKASLANAESRWIPEIRHAMPHIPILLVATQIDEPWSAHRRRVVSYDEGLQVAKRNNLGYTEMRGLLNRNVKDCFEKAVHIADKASKSAKSQKKRGFRFFGFGRTKPTHSQAAQPKPPERPPLDEAPRIEMQTSTIAEDLGKALEQPSYYSDVTFIVEGKTILAHKVVLCSASDFFCCVFGLKPPDQDTGNCTKVCDFNWADINEGRVAGLAGIRDGATSSDGSSGEKPQTQVTISEDIAYTTFRHVVEFLYTGLPNIPEGASAEDVVAVQKASATFCLPMLENVTKNIQNGKKFRNPSIGTFLNDLTGQRTKCLFLNNRELSDIRFKVEDQTFYAHKILLTARCETMARMFSGIFTESSKEEVRLEAESPECFLALLEYLYTDHAPIEEGDAVGIMVAADRHGQERLKNLCELYIAKGLQTAVADDRLDTPADVIGLLHTAQLCNASQLAAWCLHAISSNFLAFSQLAEFQTLEGEDLRYVNENRWPPLSYLEELEKYNTTYGHHSSQEATF